MGGASALILSQQTGCMLRRGEGGGGGASLDTFTGKGCKVDGPGRFVTGHGALCRGPGALCRAPALHHAQFEKGVHHCMYA